MHPHTDACARSRDADELVVDEQPDDRHDTRLDRRYQAHAWSRDVVTEAFLEGKLDAPGRADNHARAREEAEARRARAAAANATAAAAVLDAPVTPNPQPAAAAPPPPTEKDHPMSELAKKVTDHHASLRKQLGRDPTKAELGAAAGVSGRAVREHAQRLGLALSDGRAHRKSRGGASASRAPRASGKPRRSVAANGAHEHPEVNGIAVGGSLAIMALQAERTKIAAELDAIDKVIARMHGGPVMANPFRFPARVELRAKYGPAMLIEDQVEADMYLEACVAHAVEHGLPRDKAEEQERANLAYYAGYYGNDVRERVERLFRCAHPIFGPIARGKPTAEEAFRAGLELGAARAKEQPTGVSTVLSAGDPRSPGDGSSSGSPPDELQGRARRSS